MIWIGLCVVVGFVVAWQLAGDPVFGGILGAPLGASVGVAVGVFAGTIIGPTITTTDRDLAALQTQTGIAGSFFLGTGSVNTESVWVYYPRDADGLTHMETLPSKYGAVRETPGRPQVHCWREDWSAWTIPATNGKQCVFNVPPGSVKADYSIPTGGAQ